MIIKKTCPECKNGICIIKGAVIASKEIDGKIQKKSYNHYTCGKCKRNFLVERTLEEQQLTEKYIKSSEIKLK